MRRVAGIALLLVTGILALLAFAAAGMTAMAVGLRRASVLGIDRVASRLLARSGTAYGASRLAQDLGIRPEQRTAQTQSDDWTSRDDLLVPLARILNPSYAFGEPYEDLDFDGRYGPLHDTFSIGGDWDGNGRRDSWTGRLRGRYTPAGVTFALRITGNRAGIPLNAGAILGQEASNLDAPRGPGPLDTPFNPDPPYRPNRRLQRILDNLATVTGAAPGFGEKVISHRPAGGYQSVRRLESVLGASDYAKVAPFLSVTGRPDPRAFADRPDFKVDRSFRRLFADPRIPVNLVSAPPEVLAALLIGLSTHYAWEYANEGSSMKLPNIAALPVGSPQGTVNVDSAVAGRVSAWWAASRPFRGRYEMFRRMDADKATLFPPPHYGTVPAGVLDVPVPLDPQMVQAQYVNLIVDNAFVFKRGGCAGVENVVGVDAAPGPYGFTTYDLLRWAWSDGDTRLPQTPGAEMDTGTTELELEPELTFRIESLGRIERGPGDRVVSGAAIAWEGMRFVRSRSQSDFENRLGHAHLEDGVALKGFPFKERCQSIPLLPLAGCPDLESHPQFGYSRFVGDIRLMDRTDPRGFDAELYCPFWEIGQPLRPQIGDPGVLRARDSFKGVQGGLLVNGSGTVDPTGSDADFAVGILCREFRNGFYSPGRCSASYTWGFGSPNAGRMPWISQAGRGEGGAIEFWTDGGTCFQNQPMAMEMGTARAVQRKIAAGSYYISVSSSPLALVFRQTDQTAYRSVLTEAYSPIRFQCGIWNHAAFVLDASSGDTGAVQGFLNGIFQLASSFEVRAENSGMSQDFIARGDEIRVYTDPGRLPPARIAASAQQSRYWEDGSYLSPLHVLPAATVIAGARWEGFVPAALQGAELPLAVDLRVYADPEGTSPIGEWRPLSHDGGWKWTQVLHAKSFRYRVRMNGTAVAETESLRDTPVFEGIAVGWLGTRLTEAWSD